MNATELIEYNGFNPEVHHVTTEDGFILGQCSSVQVKVSSPSLNVTVTFKDRD